MESSHFYSKLCAATFRRLNRVKNEKSKLKNVGSKQKVAAYASDYRNNAELELLFKGSA